MKNIKTILCVLAGTLAFFVLCLIIFLLPFCHIYKKPAIKLEEVTHKDFIEALDLTNRDIDYYKDGEEFITIYVYENSKFEKYMPVYLQLCEDINNYIDNNPESDVSKAIISVYWQETNQFVPLCYCNALKSYQTDSWEPSRCLDENNDYLHAIEIDFYSANHYFIQQNLGLNASIVVINMRQSTTGQYTKDQFEFLQEIDGVEKIVINYDAPDFFPEEVLKTVHEVMPKAELYATNYGDDLRKYEP